MTPEDSGEEVRAEWVYATPDGVQVLRIDAPAGYILPPTIEAHRSMVGAVTFYEAACFGIEIKPGGLA